MFGRSGQMFPRRAFHDAIYEEEYGSETEDECCRGRGLSAILCWFLSVIILIGLAASVVLTVFFILKSRNFIKTNDVDVLYEGNLANGISYPTTTELNLDFTSIAKNGPYSTTARPPRVTTKKNAVNEKTASGGSKESLFNLFSLGSITKTRDSDSHSHGSRSREGSDDFPHSPSDEPTSTESRERRFRVKSAEKVELPPTSTVAPPGQVLFTSPPDSRRNAPTTRFPIGRTSFSTGGPTQKSKEDGMSQNARYNPYGGVDEEEDSETGESIHSPNRKEVGDSSGETELKKMLLDQIPPHEDTKFHHTATTKDSTTTETTDTLARIIKNLAPKWRNRTESTTSFPTTTENRYDLTITTKDRLRSRESQERLKYQTTTPKYAVVTPEPVKNGNSRETSAHPMYGQKLSTLGSRRGNFDNPIEIIKSPDLRNKKDQDASDSKGNGQFMDVLVGSEDRKTLVTKQTDDGIVTAAILPPWYDANKNSPENISELLALNGSTASVPVVKTLNDSHADNEADGDDKGGLDDDVKEEEDGSYPTSEFDLLMNLFSRSPLPKSNHSEGSKVSRAPVDSQAEASSQKTNVDKKQTQPANFKSMMRDLIPAVVPTKGSPASPVPQPESGEDVDEAADAFQYESPDGSTNIYGYYPDEDEDDKIVETHGVESQKLSEAIDPMEDSSSHVIDVTYHPKTRPEIVIERDIPDEEEYDAAYTEPFPSGSHLHQKVLPAPSHMLLTGGGIRRPFSNEEDLEFAETGQGPRRQFSGSAVTSTPPIESTTSIQKPLEPTMESNDVSKTGSNSKTDSKANEISKPEEDDEPTKFEQVPTGAAEIAAAIESGLKVAGVAHLERSPLQMDSQEYQTTTIESPEDRKSSGSATGSGDNKTPTAPDDEYKSPTGPDEEDSDFPDSDDNPVKNQVDGKRTSNDKSRKGTPTTTVPPKVQKVYSVSYPQPVTQKPMTTESTGDKASTGFVPPKPENFHENKYTFSSRLPETNAGFPSKDGWRPVMLGNRETSSPTGPSSTSYANRSSPPNSPYYHTTNPAHPSTPFNNSPQSSSTTTVTSSTAVPPTHEEYDEDEEEDEEYDSDPHQHLDSSKSGNNDRWRTEITYGQKMNTPSKSPVQQTAQSQTAPAATAPQTQNNKLPIKPSPQIPANLIAPRIKFPEVQQQQQQQQQDKYADQSMQRPIQAQSAFQNGLIDRAKYLVRPAPPPIVMRRAPHAAPMPFVPPPPPANRAQQQQQQQHQQQQQAMASKVRQQFLQSQEHQRQQLQNQRQMQDQQRQKFHGPDFNSRPPQQQQAQQSQPQQPVKSLTGPGRPELERFADFRPRGNVHWPSEDDRRKLFTQRG